MINLGIVAALNSEARTLSNRPLRTQTVVQLRENTLLKVSGLGAKRARAAAESLLAKGATALLSWGSAGGLAANLIPGNLILPETIISSDQSVFPVDADWHARLCRLLRGYEDFLTWPLAESPTVLTSPAEKRAFSEHYDAMAVDMESASVARTASDAGVPFIVVRAIADPIDITLPVSGLEAIDRHGRLQPIKLLQGLVRNPAELFLLIRLARHFCNARRTLATVAHLAGDNLFGLLGPASATAHPRHRPST